MKKQQSHFQKTILTNVLKNSTTATIWAFELLLNLGEITLQSFLAPNIYADLPKAHASLFSKNKQKKTPKFKEITIRQSLRRLEKMGFIQRKNNSFVFTRKGREFSEYISQMGKAQENIWDKKYRVVIFDIPEKKREVRNWLRYELKLLDYRKLQNSVFIGKYALPKCVIQRIKQEKISNCVNYLLVEKAYKNVF